MLQQLMAFPQIQLPPQLLQQLLQLVSTPQATADGTHFLPPSSTASALPSDLYSQLTKQKAADNFDSTSGGQVAQAPTSMQFSGQQYQAQVGAPTAQFTDGFAPLQTYPMLSANAAEATAYYMSLHAGASDARGSVSAVGAAVGPAAAEVPHPSGPGMYHNNFRTYLGE